MPAVRCTLLGAPCPPAPPSALLRLILGSVASFVRTAAACLDVMTSLLISFLLSSLRRFFSASLRAFISFRSLGSWGVKRPPSPADFGFSVDFWLVIVAVESFRVVSWLL